MLGGWLAAGHGGFQWNMHDETTSRLWFFIQCYKPWMLDTDQDQGVAIIYKLTKSIKKNF